VQVRVSKWLALTAVLAVGAACGDQGPAIPDLVGTWDATKLEFTRVANPSQKVDVIALGATFWIALDADSTWLAVVTIPLSTPDTTTGTWSAGTDVVTLQEDGATGNQQFDYVLSGSTLTLTGANVDYDFGTGDEPATLDVTAVKR
jgi:hypothetical protein